MNKRTLIIGCAVIVGMLTTPTFARENHQKGNGLRTTTQVVKLVTHVVGTQTQIVVVNPPMPVVVHRPVVVTPRPKVEVKPQVRRRL